MDDDSGGSFSYLIEVLDKWMKYMQPSTIWYFIIGWIFYNVSWQLYEVPFNKHGSIVFFKLFVEFSDFSV